MEENLKFHDYPKWISKYEPRFPEDNASALDGVEALSHQPFFVVMAIGSNGMENGDTQIYRRFSCASLEINRPPRELTQLLDNCECEFVVFLSADATLAPHALVDFTFAINENPDRSIFFADQDNVRNGARCDPIFKTAFDPILARGRDSIGVPVAFRKSRITQLSKALIDEPIIGAENLLYELGLLLVAGGLASEVCHIPAVLAHKTDVGNWSAKQARSALKTHIAADCDRVEPCRSHPQWSRIIFANRTNPQKVSCIIPTRDQPDHLRRTLHGLLTDTDYENLEVIILDNGTEDAEALSILAESATDGRVKILTDRGKFNYSRLNNLGAAQAEGEIFVLLNNDMEIVESDWLRLLAGYAEQPDIGAVGAKLLYPNGRVQHAGIAFGPNYEIEHKHRFEQGRGSALPSDIALSRCVSAVTGACLALRANVFHAMNGLDAHRFPVAYNDIDLCRRIAAIGLKIVYAADVELIHHESVSRGTSPTIDSQAREHNEELEFWKKHAADYERPDPYCSPNVVYEFGRTMLSCPPQRQQSWVPREARPLRRFIF